MICECKSKAFYLHLIYKHDIPLKLTIAKGIVFGKQGFHGAYIISIWRYMLIYLYRYCVVYLLLYCMLTAWEY